MVNIDELSPLLAEFDLTLDTLAKERFKTYATMLTEWNEKVNLTAITDPQGILYKHFYDCLLFLKHIKIPQNASVIDVGTGAGFPGLVLKIARPDINLTLLDGLDKRLKFLGAVLNATNLEAELLHSRAEDAGRNECYRERFDIATARAVANLRVLSELCCPLVKKNGLFVSMKGDGGSDEAYQSQNAFKLLGMEKPSVIDEKLPGGDSRTFIISKKISQTSPKYPRNYGKIKKSPL